ncbi:MAG TPA: hypothetical protein VGA73_04780, partial [Candidatus Binatia bacterium]
MRHRILRALFWLGAAAAALVVVGLTAAWLYSRTESFRSLLGARALAALGESIDGEVAFDGLDGSIWRSVRIRGLSVRQNGREVLAAPVVTIRISLLRQALAFLFSRRLHVAEIAVRQPVIRALQDARGEWNLASLVKKKKPDEPRTRSVSVFLDRIRIDGGRIDARRADGREARIDRIILDGSAALLPSGAEADLAGLDFLLHAGGFPDSRWEGALSYDGSHAAPAVELRRLAVRTEKSQIELAGTVKDFAAPVTSLRLELKKVAAEEIRIFLPALPLSQDFSGSLSAEGPRSATKIAGALAAADGRVKTSLVVDWSRGEPRLQGDVEAERVVLDKIFALGRSGGAVTGRVSLGGGLKNLQATAAAEVADLKIEGWRLGLARLSGNLKDRRLALQADAKGRPGGARLQGQVDFAGPWSYELALAARDFDLQKTAADGAAAPAVARVSADVRLKGRGRDARTAEAEAGATLLPSRLGAVPRAEGEAALKLRGGALVIDALRLRSEDATLAARGRIGLVETSPASQLTYTVRAKEIRPWLALAGVQGSGRVDVDGTAAGALASPRLEGKAELANASVAGNSLQSGSVRWTLSDVGGAKMAGQVRAAATGAEVGVPFRALELSVGLKGKAPTLAQVDLAAEDRERRSHRLKAEVSYFPERVEALVQELSLQLAGGVWRNPGPARVVVRGKTADVDGLALQRGAQAIRAQGKIGLEGN